MVKISDNRITDERGQYGTATSGNNILAYNLCACEDETNCLIVGAR